MNLPLTDVKKIAVFRALQLGDMLCAVPALRALRTAYPQAEIVLLGLPWANGFVKRFSRYLNRFIHFPGYEGLPEQPYDAASYHDFQQLMLLEKFDLLLQMQGNGTIVNHLLQQWGARYLAGFHNADSRMNSELFVEYPAHAPEIERHLALLQHLGIPEQGKQMEFPVTTQDNHEIKDVLAQLHHKKFVCIHPGSRGAWRQWPPQYFALLADSCAARGFAIVVTGTNEERDITRELIKCIRHPVMDLTGQTSIGGMAALLQHATLLIANCTGVSHLAAALQTPSFIISMDGEPERWAPLNKQLHHMVDWTKNPHFDKLFPEADAFINQQDKKAHHKVA